MRTTTIPDAILRQYVDELDRPGFTRYGHPDRGHFTIVDGQVVCLRAIYTGRAWIACYQDTERVTWQFPPLPDDKDEHQAVLPLS